MSKGVMLLLSIVGSWAVAALLAWVLLRAYKWIGS